VTMRRYAAFLRGVSPMNAKMPELKRCFEAAGFRAVNTVLSSGNVVFDAPKATVAALQRKVEAAMRENLAQPFLAIVRPVEELQRLLESDPYHPFRLPANAKRVVTFLRERPAARPKLPVSLGGARILWLEGGEAFSAYVPGDKTPFFMTLIERTFGREVTTRTWETVKKVAAR